MYHHTSIATSCIKIVFGYQTTSSFSEWIVSSRVPLISQKLHCSRVISVEGIRLLCVVFLLPIQNTDSEALKSHVKCSIICNSTSFCHKNATLLFYKACNVSWNEIESLFVILIIIVSKKSIQYIIPLLLCYSCDRGWEIIERLVWESSELNRK